MKNDQNIDLIGDFRDASLVRALAQRINRAVTRPIKIMEICGGHTHSIMKFGLPSLLSPMISFIHGPGCPVCVMPKSRIDWAIALARTPDVIFCTLADMLRVPGSDSSLAHERALGRDIRALYTPLDVIRIARENPQKRVVFFAIGFETTAPMTCALIERTLNLGLSNVFFHINHVTVPATISALLDDPSSQIDAFIAPSHVSVITGSEIYATLAAKYKRAFAVSGFEPVDILAGVLNLVTQHAAGTHEVYNEYARAVTPQGNTTAQALLARYFEPCEFEWRGLGAIADSGYDLKSEFSAIDAKKNFDYTPRPARENRACICGQILRGLAKPPQCPVFGRACTPQSPIGSCMVSSEGACAAYYKYQRVQNG